MNEFKDRAQPIVNKYLDDSDIINREGSFAGLGSRMEQATDKIEKMDRELTGLVNTMIAEQNYTLTPELRTELEIQANTYIAQVLKANTGMR